MLKCPKPHAAATSGHLEPPERLERITDAKLTIEELRTHQRASPDHADGAALLTLIMHLASAWSPTCHLCSKAYGETEGPA